MPPPRPPSLSSLPSASPLRRLRRGRWGSLAPLLVAGLLLEGGSPAAAGRSGTLTVALINGGMSPEKNFESHLVHLEGVRAALLARGVLDAQMTAFISDGGAAGGDMARQASTPDARRWLLAGTHERSLLPPVEVVDTAWVGGAHQAATPAAVADWLSATAGQQARGDTLLLYVTDHGYRDRETGAAGLWMWPSEKVAPPELGAWLAEMPAGARTVLVMSQCYSGAFAELAWAGGPPTGDLCGFFSVPATRPAYGCYPDGRSRAVGHGYQLAEALPGARSLDDAHRWVDLADRTPDVPLSTSDLYLQHLLQEATDPRASSVEEQAQALLDGAPAGAVDWSEADRLAAAFGLPPVRRLEALDDLQAEVEALAEGLRSSERRWQKVRERAASDRLEAILAAQPALEGLQGEARAAALVAAAQAREDWPELAALAAREAEVEAAAWRLQSREGGIERVRAALLTQAGEQLLAQQPRASRAARQALLRLRACEAAPIGSPAAPLPPLPEDYPSLDQERALIAALTPSFLGVRFTALDAQAADRAGLAPEAGAGAGAGAVRVERVTPDSPAERAGLQAEDILLGPPGQPFQLPHQLGAWVALSDRSQPVPLVVRRGRTTLTVSIALVPDGAD